MKLSLITDTVKPGAKAILTVASKFMSTIDLLATDTRNMLLRTGNDLSFDQVFNELDVYNQNRGDENQFFNPMVKWWGGPFYDTFVQKFLVNLMR